MQFQFLARKRRGFLFREKKHQLFFREFWFMFSRRKKVNFFYPISVCLTKTQVSPFSSFLFFQNTKWLCKHFFSSSSSSSEGAFVSASFLLPPPKDLFFIYGECGTVNLLQSNPRKWERLRFGQNLPIYPGFRRVFQYLFFYITLSRLSGLPT